MTRRRGIAAIAMVIVLLVVASTLAFAYFHSSTALAREEHIMALGEQALVVAQNAIDEAFYAIFTRVNSPSESRRFEPDLYESIRSMPAGSKLQTEMKSVLSWRTPPTARFSIRPVKVTVQLDSFEEQVSVQNVPGSITQALSVTPGPPPVRITTPLPPGSPAPTASSPIPGVPAGTTRRLCYTAVNYVPQITWRRLARGQLKLSVGVDVRGGQGIGVGRDLEVAHEVRFIQISGNPALAWVDIVPIQSYQLVDRRTFNE